MKAYYGEGFANHTSFESCGNCSNAKEVKPFAEQIEGRELTKGNTISTAAVRTQGRVAGKWGKTLFSD